MPEDEPARKGHDPSTVPALRVKQWLPEWDQVPFDAKTHRAKPAPHFYTFSLPATVLKRLTGVHKRAAEPGVRRADELATQRLHEKDRSSEIAEFVKFGFPWSTLSPRQREEQHPDLRKPGWLPTAILINVLRPGDERDGRVLAEKDAVHVDADDNSPFAYVRLPEVHGAWEPSEGGLHPFEVIDGQHRLWAFEEGVFPDDYELPVTAFVGLDRSWQAYLFWSINITPKKINASLAYDLYPLLRGEEWLERFAGPYVYRESRAQELVEALWAHPVSPWHNRINMLGERGRGQVRQAAYVRTLTATLVRPAEGHGVRIGGLFGARAGEHELVVPWSRPQQAAFLIRAWRELFDAIEASKPEWAEVLTAEDMLELAPFARHSLLNTDQGVRAFLGTLNDLTVVRRSVLEFDGWQVEQVLEARDFEDISHALETLSQHRPLSEHLRELGWSLATFDWRTSQAPGIEGDARMLRLTFRGSSGYNQLRRALLEHIIEHSGVLQEAATAALEALPR